MSPLNFEDNEYELMKKVVYSHFIDNKKQNIIAKDLNLSFSKVSRLITKAREEGYVEIRLNFPDENETLKKKLIDYFNLDYCYISGYDENTEMLNKDISQKLFNYIQEHTTTGAFVGVSWGETLKNVSTYFEKSDNNILTIMQLNGGITHTTLSTNSTLILKNFERAFGNKVYLLPTPSIVSYAKTAKALMEDASIKETLNLYNSLDMAIFSVGNVNNDIISVNAGYFNSEQVNQLRDEGFVGDIASRFYLSDGSYVDNDLYNRAIGIDLDTLKKVPKKVGVVLSKDKLESTVAALNGDYINILFINLDLAKNLVNYMEEKHEEINRN